MQIEADLRHFAHHDDARALRIASHIDAIAAERDALRFERDAVEITRRGLEGEIIELSGSCKRLRELKDDFFRKFEAAEARALALETALAAMFAVYEGVYDMAVPDRHQSDDAKRACDLAESALAQPKEPKP